LARSGEFHEFDDQGAAPVYPWICTAPPATTPPQRNGIDASARLFDQKVSGTIQGNKLSIKLARMFGDL
jgi:hypothetical protein